MESDDESQQVGTYQLRRRQPKFTDVPDIYTGFSDYDVAGVGNDQVTFSIPSTPIAHYSKGSFKNEKLNMYFKLVPI